MKTLKAIITISLVFILACPANSHGQYIAHYLEKDHIHKDTLVDDNGIKFFIDKKRIYITALDANGKQLWKTDPAIDNKLAEYRKKAAYCCILQIWEEPERRSGYRNRI